jgi:hypothetical protein
MAGYITLQQRYVVAEKFGDSADTLEQRQPVVVGRNDLKVRVAFLNFRVVIGSSPDHDDWHSSGVPKGLIWPSSQRGSC